MKILKICKKECDALVFEVSDLRELGAIVIVGLIEVGPFVVGDEELGRG